MCKGGGLLGHYRAKPVDMPVALPVTTPSSDDPMAPQEAGIKAAMMLFYSDNYSTDQVPNTVPITATLESP